MSGDLKPDALCPECGTPLREIVDVTYPAYVNRKYLHRRASLKARPKSYCRAFMERAAADAQRHALEDRSVAAS